MIWMIFVYVYLLVGPIIGFLLASYMASISPSGKMTGECVVTGIFVGLFWPVLLAGFIISIALDFLINGIRKLSR